MQTTGQPILVTKRAANISKPLPVETASRAVKAQQAKQRTARAPTVLKKRAADRPCSGVRATASAVALRLMRAGKKDMAITETKRLRSSLVLVMGRAWKTSDAALPCMYR